MMFAYATSHRIEVVSPGVLRKDLRADALVDTARDRRPAFLHDARREPEMYRQVLDPLRIGPRWLGGGRDWVLLEQLDAAPLWQVGELSVWCEVARWLAAMHRRLDDVPAATIAVPLLYHDEALMRVWRRRAERTDALPTFLVKAHERAVARLSACRRQLIHGDFYPSNVLVRPGERDCTAAPPDVWPVDWELAASGPAVFDLAALTSGEWTTPARDAMAVAYFEATEDPTRSWATWCADLRAARLHICMQWLGWARGWTPPPEHRHNWYAEAVALAGET
jgi:Ser/Thr protein kinase RdoA (MazF antagonist)